MSVADVLLHTPFIVPREVCRNFERASRLEWLETNHSGAFAMGTVAGVNTRRYHALLVASLNPPADRFSILPRLDEVASSGPDRFELATVQYPGTVQPRGCELLEEFRLDPFPIWTYCCGAAVIRKTICLMDGQNSVLVLYEADRPFRLRVRLLLAFRDYHSLTHLNSAFSNRPLEFEGGVSFSLYPDLPPLAVFHNGGFCPESLWCFNNEYLRELDRGLDFREDLFSPGSIEFDIGPAQSAWLIATLEPARLPAPIREPVIASILETEAKRRQFPARTALQSTLIRALDQFRITRFDGQPSLIAGYPWFTDWSRDTLISFPALSITGFSSAESKQILITLLRSRSQGLLPNRFSDRHGEAEHNTADATLWFFLAAHHYLQSTNDLKFLREELYPAAIDIVSWHKRGTLYNIHIDPADHLLWAGSPETQLTWMDAKVGGSPVTSRHGKAVEINALWYNVLCILAHWSNMLNFAEDGESMRAEAALVLSSFQREFWNQERQCLYDVIRPSFRDSRIRPNQLFAASLPFPLLPRNQTQQVVNVVQTKLLTKVGLRTLEPEDPAYRPHFEGSLPDRDRAYHQGTVWPWLIGPFIAACLYAHEESQEAIDFCRELAAGLEAELSACCLGSLSEVYDADPPRHPGGCPAQLWSVAQLIVALQRLGDWNAS